MNPYKILGVARTAQPQTIKKAFRRKAMEAHPDRGGSAELFRQIQLAWKVLSDKEKRKRFDETGEIEDLANNLDAAAAQALQWAMVVTIQEVCASNRNPLQVDLVELIRDKLQKRNEEIDKKTRPNLANIAKMLEALAPRFEVNGQENIIRHLLTMQIAALENAPRQLDAEIARNKRALELLKDYKFRQEFSLPLGFGAVTAATTVYSIRAGLKAMDAPIS